MRLVDADGRIAKWKAAMLHMVKESDGRHSISMEVLIEDLKNAPSIDAVLVCRCKDCKYHNAPPCPMRLSFNWTNDNDYCSYGERKDGDG